MEGKGLNEKENNYIATITAFLMRLLVLPITILSTGENKATILNGNFDEVFNELSIIRCKRSCCCIQF